MKKLFLLLGLVMLTGISYQAKAQTFSAIENQIYAQANNSCLNAWRQAYGGLVSFETSALAIADCINGNVGYLVEITAYFECPNRIAEFCRPRPPVVVAHGFLDCEGNISVTCVAQP